MIPEEIANKIGIDAMKRHPVSESRFLTYKEGAEYGYSLASEQLTAAEARIKELEAGLRLIFDNGDVNMLVKEKINQLLNK